MSGTNMDKALRIARGNYQKNIVRGYETLGGSTLKGKAKEYRRKYDESARNLISRIKESGIPHEIKLGPRGGWYSATLVIIEDENND